MLQFKNEMGLPGAIITAPDPDGIDSVYALITGTFDLDRGCEPAEEQVPVAFAPEHYGDPAAPSVRVPVDVSLSKPSTDVLLCAHAYAPGGRAGVRGLSAARGPGDLSRSRPGTGVLRCGPAYAPGGRATTVMEVSLTVGPVHRVVRIFGDRRWTAAGGGYALSYPEPFETMPLVWERAYGGTEMVDGAPQAEVRNPVGRGFHVSGGSPVGGAPARNLEDPYDPIQARKQRP